MRNNEEIRKEPRGASRSTMSQRNPMNERYQSEEHTGVSRKSAASAKPKAKAAASVIVQSSEKSPQQKKAERKEEKRRLRDEQRELDRKYYNPDTKRYKNLRRAWWACLIGAILCTFASFFGRGLFPDWLSLVTLFLAYALIILAFYIDFSKIRRERRAYQERMIALEEKQKKAERAAARSGQQHQGKKGSGKNASRNPKVQAKAAEKNAEETASEEAPEKETPKKGLFGGGLRLSGRKEKAEKQAAKDAEEARKADAENEGE